MGTSTDRHDLAVVLLRHTLQYRLAVSEPVWGQWWRSKKNPALPWNRTQVHELLVSYFVLSHKFDFI
jgi:hypothetical protein